MKTAEERREAFRAFMKRRGLVPNTWAADAGLGSPSTLYNYLASRSRSLNRETEQKLAGAIGVDIEEMYGEAQSVRDITHLSQLPPVPSPGAIAVGEVLTAPSVDVPVQGTTSGGAEGELQMGMGEPVDWVPRMPGIAKAKDVYALQVVGSSMVPALRDGALIYVHPHKRPIKGDNVVIQIVNGPAEPITAYVKEFVRMDDKTLYVLQYKPAKTLKFPRSKVRGIHKVLTTDELARG